MWIPDLSGRLGPKYLQIVEAMAEDIASERLAIGTRLPPYRELAYQLGISANTTSRAYAEAVKRALLQGEVGRGTFVRSPDLALKTDRQSNLLRERSGPIDLSRNLPIPGIAEPHIRHVLKEISRSEALPALLDYQTNEDLGHHNESGAIWLENCGVTSGPNQVLATMGGQHGLLCALMALTRPGDLLLTETLSYMPIRAMAERLGLNTAAVAMDADGAIPEAFEELCTHAKPKAFYLMPTLQVPTTVTLADTRRMQIAEIAQRHDVILLEDDVFGPLKADRPSPIATLAPEHTIYVTSLSKSVAPGLRVGFLHAPTPLVPALHHAINLSIWMTPPMTLEIAARLIRDGTAMKLATQQRKAAEHRQSLARSILGNAEFTADPHGFHLWMSLPEDRRADTFRAQSARHGVLVSDGRSFAARADDAPNSIRVCLTHEADDARLRKGLQILGNLLHVPMSASDMDI